MVYRRERPKIRKAIETLMEDYGWSAWELLSEFTRYDPSGGDCEVPFSLWYTWKVQLRKMIEVERQGEK